MQGLGEEGMKDDKPCQVWSNQEDRLLQDIVKAFSNHGGKVSWDDVTTRFFPNRVRLSVEAHHRELMRPIHPNNANLSKHFLRKKRWGNKKTTIKSYVKELHSSAIIMKQYFSTFDEKGQRVYLQTPDQCKEHWGKILVSLSREAWNAEEHLRLRELVIKEYWMSIRL